MKCEALRNYGKELWFYGVNEVKRKIHGSSAEVIEVKEFKEVKEIYE